jgi:hypothetical protein
MIRTLFGLTAICVVIGLQYGCAGDSALRASVAGANIELAKAQAKAYEQPIVDVAIPHDGAILKIVVRNPSANVQHVAMPDDPWARAMDRAVGVTGTLGGIWLGGEAAKGIVSATGGAISGALSTTPAPVIVQPSYPPATVTGE